MISYACDWCRRRRRPGEPWIVGFAAEKNGPAGRRRQFVELANWKRDLGMHPLAVHFCSREHQRQYLAWLFGRPARVPQASLAKVTRTDPGANRRLLEARAQLAARPAPKRALAPVRAVARAAPKRKRRPPLFTREDRMRAHGMGIQL